MRVGVVISTIGNSPTLWRTLKSVEDQRPHQIVVVDQSDGTDVETLAGEYGVTHVRTGRGLSLGRNAGIAALVDCEVVAFTDDDCEYAPETFSQLTDMFKDPKVGALSGRLISGTERIAFTETREVLTKKTVWRRTIEAATFYRFSVLEKIGTFDETLGIGAPTKWQSGEGTDLLIRVLGGGWQVIYEPTLEVTENPNAVADADYLAKVRKYARGTGRVYRKWYPPRDRILTVVRPLAAACIYALRGRRYEAAKKLQVSLGRLEGMVGSVSAR